MKKSVAFIISLISALILSVPGSCGADRNKTDGSRPGDGGDEVASAEYMVKFAEPRQIIEGIGVELQSDAFGPNYKNTDAIKGVPHELTASERYRLSTEMLTGFRYMRIAAGLWFRGVTADGKNIVERYPGQAKGILDLMKNAGMEAISYEYWSVAPYWKSNNRLVRGKIKQFDAAFLDKLGDALVKDVRYMQGKGFKIRAWGLQNEAAQPESNSIGYPHVYYTPDEYVKVFKAVAPKIKAALPGTEIIAETMNGCLGAFGKAIRRDSAALAALDTWVYHKTGSNADLMIEKGELMSADRSGKPIYTNEYEYNKKRRDEWSDEFRLVNTANNIMNWMTFLDAPAWYWLHALKPINDSNHKGFGLGVYRPQGYTEMQDEYSHIAEGHWVFQPVNFNGVAGFAKHLPWDSRRYHVAEPDPVLKDQRIMSWKSPDGKRGFVLTNRSDKPFDFVINVENPSLAFQGYLYDMDCANKTLDKITGKARHTIRLAPWSIQFWVEQ